MAKEDLYKELKRQITNANRRLLNLEKLTGKEYSWAGQKLFDELSLGKLNAWTSKNRVRIDESMTEEQLERVAYSVNKFLNTKMSTIRGVKKRAKSIKSSFSSGIGVSMEMAEKIYQAFEEDVIKWALRYMDASELWALINEAIETNMSRKRFEDEFIKRADIVGKIDADFRDMIRELYNKEVKG